MIKRIPWEIAICDWNGTLLNDLYLVYGSVCNIFKYFSLTPPSLETYQKEISTDFLKFYRKYGVPDIIKPELLNSLRKKFFEDNNRNANLSDGAQELLNSFRKFDLKIGIVSGEAANYLDGRLKQFGIREYFDFVYDGVKNKKQKFREITDIYEIPAEKMFYIDDSFDGVSGARKIGLTTFGFIHEGSYNTAEMIKKAEPDYIVSSLPEIIPIISKIK